MNQGHTSNLSSAAVFLSRITGGLLLASILLPLLSPIVAFAEEAAVPDAPASFVAPTVSTPAVESAPADNQTPTEPAVATPASIESNTVVEESNPIPTTAEAVTTPETAIDFADQAGQLVDQKSEEKGVSSYVAGATKEVQIDNKQIKRLTSVDENNGSLLYNYTFDLPTGRNGLAPTLNLTYNSSNKANDSIVGYGWSFDLPYITRVNKTGSDKLYSTNNFTSSLDGELVQIATTTYRAMSDNGDFHYYTFSNNQWVLYDKEGMKYSFGKTTSSRQDDPDNPARVYKWQIDDIRDPNNNYIKFEYFKDKAQIYPARIVYTGNGSTDGIYTITFTLENYEKTPTMYNADFAIRNRYRIKGVEVAANGTWIRKYDLAYTPGDNGSRSLLSQITETGNNGTQQLTKAPTIFNYQKRGPIAWELTTNGAYNLPEATYHYDSTRPPTFIKIIDVNGDGYPDELNNKDDNGGPCQQGNRGVWINNAKGGFTNQLVCSGGWEIPVYFFDKSYSQLDGGVRAFDYNGDLLPDLVKSVSSGSQATLEIYSETYLNQATNTTGWLQTSTSSLPFSFVFGLQMHADNGTEITDVNGDGINDAVFGYYREVDYGPRYIDQNVYLGDGSGRWVTNTSSSTWQFPTYFIDQNSNNSYSEFRSHAQLVDVNGDGLTDVFYKKQDEDGVFTNRGHRWDRDTVPINIPFCTEYCEQRTGNSDAGTRASDLNGDGLIDFINILTEHTAPGNWGCNAFLNRGETFPNLTYVYCGEDVEYFSRKGWSSNVMLLDINADGLDDMVINDFNSGDQYNLRTRLAKGTPFTDTLVNVQTPEGASTTVSYKMSTKYFDQSGNLLNPKLPLLIPTVETIKTDDGLGNISTDTYTYADGHYYYNNPTDRKFAGFGLTTKTDSGGTVTKTYYHQGNVSSATAALGEYNDNRAKIGKPYRTELYNKAGVLQSTQITKWDSKDIKTGWTFVYLATVLSRLYNSAGASKDSAVTYAYNTGNGNLNQKKEWGEVTGANNGTFTDIGTDSRTTDYTYAQQDNNGVYAVSGAILTNQSGAKEQETKYFYDNQLFGKLTKGNKTKEENWITGSTYASTTIAYNAYGLPIALTNPLGKITTTQYDTYNIFPTKTTSPLGYFKTITYNYLAGKPASVTDENNNATSYAYDPLGRPFEVKIPDDTTGAAVLATSYTYVDTPKNLSQKKSDYLTNNFSVSAYNYFDGLGRVIQEKTQVTNGYQTTDTVYNNLGQVVRKSLPYSNGSSVKTNPVANNNLYLNYTYDALGRVTAESNALGTTTHTYNLYDETVTDALGKNKKYTTNAFGQLVAVTEYLNNIPYQTKYEYNASGNIAKLTDASNNLRNFTYDGRGLQTAAQDLHAATSTAFGTRYHVYNWDGSLIQYVTPISTVNYTYNNDGQILTENNPATTGIDITYTQNAPCENGKTRLCSVIRLNQVVTDYTYTKTGRLKSEKETISTQAFATGYTYSRRGDLLTTTYPDNSSLIYALDNGGRVNSASYKASAAASSAPVAALTYAPNGAISTITYGNGLVQTNTYDTNKLYRLTSKVAGAIQNLAYTYDAVGNITSINDTSNSLTKKKVTYTYDDLYRLLSASTTNAATNYKDTYTYNILGNILTKNNDAYQYAANTTGTNPHAPTKAGVSILTYDRNGNLLTDGDRTNAFTYRNEVASIKRGATTTVYAYDHAGKRVKETAGLNIVYTPTTSYTYDGSLITKYLAVNGLPVARVETKATTSIYYLVTDHLGSIDKVANQAGALVETTDYSAYGGERTRLGSQSKRKYIGEVYDSGTGYNYLNARYYDSTRGQFISQDPMFWDMPKGFLLDPQSQNSYSYARNNPVNLKDPSGKDFGAGELILLSAVLVQFGPQIHAFGQSLMAPLGQVAVSQAGEDLSKGKYLWAAFGLATAGEMPEGKITPVFDGIWSKGTKNSPAANAISHSVDHAAEFGVKGVKEYVQSTRNFINKAINESFMTKLQVGDRYDIMRTYDASSNTFSVFEVNKATKAVTPRSMFTPNPAIHGFQTNLDYFNSQRGALVDLKKLFKQ